MHQKKEKNDQPVQAPPDPMLKLLSMLETSDCNCTESIMNLIHENLHSAKDSRALNSIVEYYIAAESHHSLDILVRLKEPHDKHLFDKISELMKNETYRYRSLQLLMNLVYRQPPWLHKIANHRIMHTIFSLLKTDQNAPNLMSGLFILICLLPMIPSQFGPFLHDTFDIFSKLASWGVRKPSFIVDVYMVHLQVVIYALFHRLYGMFPCNFLAYLRSYYGGSQYNEENYKVFSLIIKPMLERVRLHPLLVTASKETELSPFRWKKMAYHDVIVECASISLDAIEGMSEPTKSKHSTLTPNEQLNSYDSLQFNYPSNQSSCSTTYESEGIGSDSISSRDMIWSPNGISTLTPPHSSSIATSPLLLKGEQELVCTRQLSTEEVPLDFAVEAKPELLKVEAENLKSSVQTMILKDLSHTQGTSDLEKASMSSACESLIENTSILPAIEAKEDVDVDKEVSELTSGQNSSKVPATDTRYDTPFCSTTQNLTDEPRNLPKTSALERSDSLTKSQEEDGEEMFNSLQETDMETFVPPFNRYRFFSHCGPPPEIPTAYLKKPKVFRSISCPANLYPSDQNVLTTVICCSGETIHGQENVVTCSSGIASTSAFVPVSSNASITSSHKLATYEELIPLVVNPLSDLKQNAPLDFQTRILSQSTLANSLSPPELLDHYIQLGNRASLNNIPIPSSTNTDWTHFGGKPPPDEVSILRTQILLLHNQLLFERHRKDVHSERNRRILGRAKRFKMQEEQIAALKEQIQLLEQYNRDLKNQSDKKSKSYHQLLTEKQQIENNLHSRILKAEQEIKQLQFSNSNLQKLLVSQKQENDEIREFYKKCQLEILLLKHEVDHANKKASLCQKMEKDSVFLSKQLILLQELITHYKDKMEMLKEVQQPDIGDKLMNDAALLEIKDLKQRLELKCYQLEMTVSKVTDLEQSLSDLKAKQKEQMKVFEDIKSFHKDEIVVRDERLEGLKKMSIQKDSHILSLYDEIETLSEQKADLLKKQMNGNVSPADATYQSAEVNVLSQSSSYVEANIISSNLSKDSS
ncbi:hamartin [Trichonephila inaurata madagascariensis]|uniref:Hamartin n=1 Tax=Trichonephila inaurata madagascariensis TaxID=2747483 RepID=A0A8X6IV21_9ARAC|nr:hamartin [Trichonephila inaurata madagascariensis]